MKNELFISDYLKPLGRFGSAGKVHSIFDHSFNIQVDQQLIHVSQYHQYLSSYGIGLSPQLFEALHKMIRVGDWVKVRNDYLSFYSRAGIQTIDLAFAHWISLQVKGISFTCAQCAILKEQLQQSALKMKIGLMIDHRTQYVIDEMHKENPNWKQIVGYLSGRGIGLTPSGDDILTGYALILSVIDAPKCSGLFDEMKKIKNTTIISRAYFETAILGYVHSLVYQLLISVRDARKEIIKKNLHMLLNVGHSSGADLAFGMYIALSR